MPIAIACFMFSQFHSDTFSTNINKDMSNLVPGDKTIIEIF